MSKKEYNFDDARRGAVVQSPPNTTRITIRIDTDVLNWFRSRVHQVGGGDYQTFINKALREYIQDQDNTPEKTLHKAPHEELNSLLQTI